MSTIITDYHNLASQGPSDNLRRQLGKFYASGINSFSPVSISDEKINILSIVTDSTLAPSKFLFLEKDLNSKAKDNGNNLYPKPLFRK